MNQIITSSKTNQRWKTASSLIMGIISIIPILHLLSRASNGLESALAFVSPIEVFSLAIFSIPGMILGIIRLRSKQKKIAIAGIIFSVIGLLGLICILYFLWILTMSQGW